VETIKMIMMARNTVILNILFAALLFSGNLHAKSSGRLLSGEKRLSAVQNADSLKWSVDFLNRLFYSCGEWYLTDPSLKKPIRGVLNYAENDPLDTSLVNIRRILGDTSMVRKIDRRPQDIHNVKDIPGYLSDTQIEKEIEVIGKNVFDSLNNSNIVVPIMVMETELAKAPNVPEGDPVVLLGKQRELPAEFVANLNKKIAAVQFPPNMTGAAMDSTFHQLFVSYREVFNDSIINRYKEKIAFRYKTNYIAGQSDTRIKAYKNAAAVNNFNLLTAYNNMTVGSVNDSLKIALQYLAANAESDSTLLRLYNLNDHKTELWTANRDMKPIRMFLKNAQNDSLSVVLYNNGKGELKLVIDDGVKLTRFSETQNKTVTFHPKAPDKQLKKVTLQNIVLPPWTLFGNGSAGFTQTALSNWAKGGESSLTLLIISKYNANYSKNKSKWENSAEFRYGINQSKSRGLEKNDDKIEFQTRYGYSAFKKWYYSGESNFRTQIAKGYAFPDKVNPISAFMAPAFWTWSVGLDYKPNKDFSLFLSPFTSKTTFITDTVMIKPSTYGLEPGKKKLWEPGLIVKTNWHKNLAENITYDTKAELFNNYRYPFQKFSFEWEQIFLMRINRFINTRVITQVLYDYNTKFPIYDDSGKEIGRKPKWQFKELFTIGLTYKF
jgi:hypothetical protein